MSETFHVIFVIFAAIMTSYFAGSALLEFRKRNTGLGWYYNVLGLIAAIYLWFLVFKATP